MPLYRALRTDELYILFDKGIVSRCPYCNENHWPECCNKDTTSHVSRGSSAQVKSRYISTTKDEYIAAWHCSNKTGDPKEGGKSATYIEIKISDNNEDIEMMEACDVVEGVTAKNRAISSCETLVTDRIPFYKITGVYRVKEISKREYDNLDDSFLFYAKRRYMKCRTMVETIRDVKKYLLVCKIWSMGEPTSSNILTESFPLVIDDDDDSTPLQKRRKYGGGKTRRNKAKRYSRKIDLKRCVMNH